MNGYAGGSCQVFQGHSQAMLPAWKLLFAGLSQQNQLDVCSLPALARGHVSHHMTRPEQERSSSGADPHPDPLPCWKGRSSRLGKQLLISPRDLATLTCLFFPDVSGQMYCASSAHANRSLQQSTTDTDYYLLKLKASLSKHNEVKSVIYLYKPS